RTGRAHRSSLVRHLYRARRRDGADHATGRLQPLRAAGDDQSADHVDRASGHSDVRADVRRCRHDLALAAAHPVASGAYEMKARPDVALYAAKMTTPFAVLGLSTDSVALTALRYLP